MLKRIVARVNVNDRGASLVEYGLLVVAILVAAASAPNVEVLRSLLP